MPATPTSEAAASFRVRAELIDGWPYLLEPLPKATLYYEPWIDYQTVQLVKEAFGAAQEVLHRELGVAEVPPLTLYLTLEMQFNHFATANEFPHPSWLAGFYYYIERETGVSEAKIYVNSEAQGLAHNVAHELTHLTTIGLPTWLGEGVGEYIGSRVQAAMKPQANETRFLASRWKVRQAAERDMLLDREELENVQWTASEDYELLDLAYAEAWQLVEYVARNSAPHGLRDLVGRYRQELQEGEDPFPLALGISTDKVWQGFRADILDNMTAEERVGANLCTLVQFSDRGAAITRDWNQFLARADLEEPEAREEQFRHFQRRWESQASDIERLPTVGETSGIRGLLVYYSQSMAKAMGEYAGGMVNAANRTVVEANLSNAQASATLRNALLERVWLAC